MPVYLAHGFRWMREGMTGIRVHAIVRNLEDVAVEYIQNEQTTAALLENFRTEFPSQMQHLEDMRTGRTLHFLEQYDPEDELSVNAVSQPHAFVADRVITIAGRLDDSVHGATSRPGSKISESSTSASKTATSTASSSPIPRHNPAALSLNVEEAMSAGPGGTPQAWEALAEIRDKIADGEKIGWWIVYNGDPERAFDDDDEEDEDEDEEDGGDRDVGTEEAEEEGTRTPTQKTSALGQPVLSLLPEGFKPASSSDEMPKAANNDGEIGTAIHHPPPTTSPIPVASEDKSSARPKSSKSFINPLSLRRKTSKPALQTPKEEIPEPPKLKEISKKEGFRHKFFGRGTDKNKSP